MITTAAVTVVAVGVALMLAKKSNQGMPGGRGRGGTTFSVKTMTLEKTTLHDYVSTNGEVESQSSIEVFPDMAGRVASVEVHLGSPVKKGQIIAYVDPNEPGVRYVKNPVYAPISGSIVSSPLKVGAKVSTNTVITTIGDINNLQISASIPERYVALLKPGLSASVRLEAYPDVEFFATVTRVSPVLDKNSRAKEIILSFDKEDSRINAGMFAKVILYTMDYENEVVMPIDSLVTKDDKYYAFVVKGDTVERREVTLGKSVNAVAQVLSGLSEGEIVVTEGQTSLSDGAKIRDITNGVQTEPAANGERAGKPADNAEKSGRENRGGAR
ncbi:MAG: efflux RND transporter periplasmic adaptor subunit [Treponema sp.]|nr:efflux RND transporter periplasmic adaptor subunit [Treponema sp.]